MVQWRRLHTPTTWGRGSIPGRGIIHIAPARAQIQNVVFTVKRVSGDNCSDERLQTPSLHSWTSCSQDWTVRSNPSPRFHLVPDLLMCEFQRQGVVQLLGYCNPAAWGLKSAWLLTTSVTCENPATLPRPQRVPNSVYLLYQTATWDTPGLLWWWDGVAYIRAGCICSIPLATPDPAHVGLRYLYGCGRWGVYRRRAGVEARSIAIPGWLIAIVKADVEVFPMKRVTPVITLFLCSECIVVWSH